MDFVWDFPWNSYRGLWAPAQEPHGQWAGDLLPGPQWLILLKGFQWLVRIPNSFEDFEGYGGSRW